jgi:hypothetical protein
VLRRPVVLMFRLELVLRQLEVLLFQQEREQEEC